MLTCEHCGQQHEETERFCPLTGRIMRPERTFPPGTMLDEKYRLGDVLGAGGMGAVFEATHTMLNKAVAVKLMLPEMARDQELVSRMVREARAASATGHRNIALVTDMGWTDAGALYFVMERLVGKTLRDISCTEGPLPLQRAAGLIAQLLNGLAAVHAKGIVHRDLKPENVMVVEGDDSEELVKILDFGISKVLDDEVSDLTRTGRVMGSPRYMSPEQAQGHPVDARTDIYGAGNLLYTLLVGRPPLNASNYNAMVAAILEGAIAPPSVRIPGLPPEIDRIALRALARDPAQRFATAAEFRDELLPFCRRALADATMNVDEQDLLPANARDLDPSQIGSLINLDEHLSSSDEARQVEGDFGEVETKVETPAKIGGLKPVATEVDPAPAGAHAPHAGPPPLDEALSTAGQPAPAEAVAPAATAASTAPARGQEARSRAADGSAEQLAIVPEIAAAVESARPRMRSRDVLELDLDDEWRGGKHPAAQPRSDDGVALHPALVGARRGGLPLAKLAKIGVVLVLAGALAYGGYSHWSSIREFFTGVPDSDEAVMLLVETEPRNASVYVDGVLAVSKPIQLSRSERKVSIRVQAPGYQTKTIAVSAASTRTVRVRLEPRHGRRRKRSKGSSRLPRPDPHELLAAGGGSREAARKLSRAQIRAHMRRLRGKVRRCALRHRVSGALRLEVTVRGSGGASARALGEMADTGVARCVIGVIQRTRFPTFRGPSTTFIYPYQLR